MSDTQTLKDPVAFFKPLDKKSSDEMTEMARVLQKYKKQMQQLRDRKQ